MYAIIEDGARQYRVSEGEIVRVDFRAVEGKSPAKAHPAEKGTAVEFGRVLLFHDGTDLQIGRPVVAGMTVVGEIVDHPTLKVVIGKYRRRKNYRRYRGHRQFYTAVRIKSILHAGQKVSAQAAAQAPAPAHEPAPAAPTAS